MTGSAFLVSLIGLGQFFSQFFSHKTGFSFGQNLSLRILWRKFWKVGSGKS